MSKKSRKSLKSAKNVQPTSGLLIIRKPKAIVFDLVGTSTKTGFIDKVLMEYIKHNVKVYLELEWEDQLTQDDVSKMRAISKKDSGPVIASSGSADSIQKSVAAYVIACIDQQRINEPLSKFRFHMWFHGYKRKKLTTPIYSDVADNMAKWNKEQIKLYIVSNSWKEVSQRLLEQTNHGNLTPYVTGYFDSTDGPMNKKETFAKIADSVAHKPENILFLTKYGEEARAAHDAGYEVILVLTHQTDLDRRLEEDLKLPLVRTFHDLKFTDDAPRLSQVDAGGSNKRASRKSATGPEARPKSRAALVKSKKSAGSTIGTGFAKSREKSVSKSHKSSSKVQPAAIPVSQAKSSRMSTGSKKSRSGSSKGKSSSCVSKTASSKAASARAAPSGGGSSVKSSMVSSRSSRNSSSAGSSDGSAASASAGSSSAKSGSSMVSQSTSAASGSSSLGSSAAESGSAASASAASSAASGSTSGSGSGAGSASAGSDSAAGSSSAEGSSAAASGSQT